MSNFESAYLETAKNEGGYSNHPNDRGGETYAGIARKFFPNWKGWNLIDELKRATGFPSILKSAPQLPPLVQSFYKTEFWDKMHLDQAKSKEVSGKVYDIAVNCGISFAAKALQRSLNVANKDGDYYPDVAVDGKIGGGTIAALNAHPKPDVIFKCLNTIQGAHYIEIAESNKSQEDFINGWFSNRIAAVIDDRSTENLA